MTDSSKRTSAVSVSRSATVIVEFDLAVSLDAAQEHLRNPLPERNSVYGPVTQRAGDSNTVHIATEHAFGELTIDFDENNLTTRRTDVVLGDNISVYDYDEATDDTAPSIEYTD
jgi:hypothetical protein